MNVVIITYDWPPRNAVSVHRPYSWAKYLAELGVDVTILTAAKRSFDEPLDLQLSTLPVTVLEISYSAGFGLADWFLRWSALRTLARRLKTVVTKKTNRLIDPRVPWRAAAQPHAIRLAPIADLVISTCAPSIVHLLAMDMKKANPRLQWVADYRDLWSQSYTNEVTQSVRQSMREQEQLSVGLYADRITAVSVDLSSKLSSFLNKPVHTITNGFDADEQEVMKRLNGLYKPKTGPIRIVYTGKIYEGYQNPEPLFAAIADLIQTRQIAHDEITVDFYGSRVGVAEELAKNPRFAPFIRLMGHVERGKALEAQYNATALLLMESSHPRARGVLTGKLFEYIVSGRPILCIGSRPEYEIGQVLRKTGTGIVIGPNEMTDLPSRLLEIIHNLDNLSWYKPSADSILEYSRRRLAHQFFSDVIVGDIENKLKDKSSLPQ